MIRMRGAVIPLAAIALVVAGCGGGGSKPASGTAGAGAAGAGGAGATGGVGGGGGTGSDASVDAKPDLATDFGVPAPEVAVHCPTAAGTLAPAAAELVIDDFEGNGRLDGRQRSTSAFTVKEQFDATAGATFNPAPAIETSCGAAGPGAAHIRGRAADTGATFTLVFSVPGDAKAVDHYDASATKGITFRVALGDASASKLVTVQVNVTQSQWDYTKDLSVSGTEWQTVTVLWSDLQSAPKAEPFSAATLNQIVFPLFADTDVNFYIDDIAFVK